jgi:hypothetical protein
MDRYRGGGSPPLAVTVAERPPPEIGVGAMGKEIMERIFPPSSMVELRGNYKICELVWLEDDR